MISTQQRRRFLLILKYWTSVGPWTRRRGSLLHPEQTYFFAFNGNAYFPASSYSYFDFHINIYLNGNLLVGGHANELSSTASEEYETVSLQSTVNLQSGDQVWLQITTANSGRYLYGLPTHFSGFLLQENMSQSLTIV